MASHSHRGIFQPCEAQIPEGPPAPAWLSPEELLVELEIRPGMRVVNIGAGDGRLALAIAGEVGPAGRVVAIEARREALWELVAKLNAPGGPRNVFFIAGNGSGFNLPDRCCDVVLMENVWRHLRDPRPALQEARRILLTGGRLAIVDWRPDAGHPPGPPLEHRVSRETIAARLRASGWRVRYSGDVGQYSHLSIAAPAEGSNAVAGF